MGNRKGSPERQIHHNTSIPQKIGKNSNTQANLTVKKPEKEQQIKPTLKKKQKTKNKKTKKKPTLSRRGELIRI